MKQPATGRLAGFFGAIMLFFVTTGVVVADQSILILNSYHRGLQWTDNITDTLIHNLKSESVDISVEYMDTKRVQASDEYYKRLVSLYTQKYANAKFDLIITTDDNAANFANKYHERIFDLAPMVFVGVNDLEFPATVDRSRITGVLEVSSEKETLELIQRLHPDATNILAIFDRTPTGEHQWNLIDKQSSAFPALTFSRISGNETLEDLELQLAQLDEGTIVLMGAYYRDASKRYIPLQEGTARISAASAQPVYTLFQQVFDNGALGGFLLSGVEHGKKAAELGRQILAGVSPSDISVVDRGFSAPVFHYLHLNKFQMLGSDLPAGSKIVGAPKSFFQIDRWIVVAAVCAIIVLIAAISTLVGVIRRKSAHHKELENLHGQISRVANTDHLTKVFNRYAFDQWCTTRPICDENVFLILIDVDNMKLVNDLYGHFSGDKVLIAVSTRIRDHGVAYRIGGDEFALIVNGTEKEAHQIAQMLIDQIAEPIKVGPKLSTIVSASIGVANLQDREAKASDLLKLADLALSKSKQEGKNRVSTYQPSLHRDIADLVEASEKVSDLTIKDGCPTFYFQPIVNLPEGGVAGYEMLLRCLSEDGRVLPVSTVISAFENIGKSRFLTQKTFEAAADFCREVSDGFITINLNKSQLMALNKASLNALISKSGLDPSLIIIEVNESDELLNSDILNIIKLLQKTGFKVALDDFGTGYSTLASIEYLPLDIVKLDKFFVAPDRRSDTTLRSVGALCSELNIPVVVEGIETRKDYLLCRNLGFKYGQGYYFAYPDPPDKLRTVDLAYEEAVV